MRDNQPEKIYELIDKIEEYYISLYAKLENDPNISDDEWRKYEKVLDNLGKLILYIKDNLI